MALPLLPLDVWTSQITQASIPANNNALRVEVMARQAIGQVSAQPASPAEGDLYIIGASPTGAQWATFTAGNLTIFKGGYWIEFVATNGLQKYIGSELWARVGGVWVNQTAAQAASLAAAVDKSLYQQVTMVLDGGTNVLQTGSFNYIYIGYACEIQSITVIADQSGSAAVTLQRDTYANHPPDSSDDITGGAGIVLTSAIKTKITTLTGWNISIPADSVLKFALTSVTNVKKLSITIKVKKV